MPDNTTEPASNAGQPGAALTIERDYFSTQDLLAKDQFDAYRERLAPLIEFYLPEGIRPDDGFAAEQTAWNLGNLVFASESSGAMRYECPPDRLRAGGVDHSMLVLYKSGNAVMDTVDTGDKVSEMHPGDVSFHTLSRPFRGHKPAADALFVYIPRELYPEAASALDNLNNTILTGGLTSLLADYLRSLERLLPSLDQAELPRVAQATQAMITACLIPSRDTLVTAEQEIAAGLLERAKGHIRRNLHSPSLSPAELCRVLNISRAQLYRIFEPAGGVARQIRTQRLVAGHAALVEPGERRRIHEIAYDFGFGSADEFSKAFRREFGYSPSEVRGTGLGRMPEHRRLAEGSAFQHWLRDASR